MCTKTDGHGMRTVLRQLTCLCVRYDIKRAGYIIVTGVVENEDILNPLALQAAGQLWNVIQYLPVEDSNDHRLTYPSICVKFPIPIEFAGALHAILPSNGSKPEQICVSNPLVEMFKFALVSERSQLNSSIDEVLLAQISEAISSDPEAIVHLLGGVTFDSDRRINGAKAIMLPYALRHCSESEDWIAEKWELSLADFLLKYKSPYIRVSWWTYETLASESAKDREQLKKYDIKRAGYIIVTGVVENEDILNPLALQAAGQLWNVIQYLPVEDSNDHRLTYPSICVKFPIPIEFAGALHAILPSNGSKPEQICVSNPLVEMFKFALVSERSQLNSSIDEVLLAQISEAISSDPEAIVHLLGGVTFDSDRRINGAKAIMLPYALRHCSESEDWIAEKWELSLADFLLKYKSPYIRVSWWTYETLASESAKDREQLKNCWCRQCIYTIIGMACYKCGTNVGTPYDGYIFGRGCFDHCNVND
ncbi:hypothetical protein Tcan_05124 [Toxocara canis]|uniref:Uncharacterized protein n=1 Tax=Toxocara canis TaxID=6265 RepID=A0A0B2V4P1_TOXCA|nr:hypothetical protein Tcan_05124 [Toxocara canis]